MSYKKWDDEQVKAITKKYFVCKECGERYISQPPVCDVCDNRKFQVMKLDEVYK